MRTRQKIAARQAGVTLLDLLVVVVIISILGAYAAMRTSSAGENTIFYQGQKLARDIRHAQVLSSTWGRPLKVIGAAGGYRVECMTPGASPCNASAGTGVTDPATGNEFSVTLNHGVGMASTYPTSSTATNFDIQGRPVTDAGAITNGNSVHTLTVSGTTVTVTVRPITGFVEVAP